MDVCMYEYTQLTFLLSLNSIEKLFHKSTLSRPSWEFSDNKASGWSLMQKLKDSAVAKNFERQDKG